MRRQNLRVAEYKHSKTSPWCIEGVRIGGKRKRLFFQTRSAAEAELNRIKIKQHREGAEALNLSDALRVMALEGDRVLKPFKKTIADAVAFFVQHLEESQKSITVRALVDEYLAMQKSRKRSAVHQKDLRLRYDRFCAVFGERLVHEITPKEIDGWLFDLNVAPVSFNNFRERIGFLFGYGIKHGYLAQNPVDDRIEKMSVVDEPPEIFSVDELSCLLEHATPELLPIFVIGAFSGLRTSELLLLDWKDVNLATGFLNVAATNSKSARRRVIKMEANLIKWLAPYAGRIGRIWKGTENTFSHARRSVCKAADIEWPDNGLRHSFASYHLAKNQNQNQLADILGHTDSKLIFSNYREVVMPCAAERYFNIFPPTPAQNVLSRAQVS